MKLQRASLRSMATHSHTQTIAFLCRQLLQRILSFLCAWFELCLAALDAVFCVLMEPKTFQLRVLPWERPAQFQFQVDSFTSATVGSFFFSPRTVMQAEQHRSVREAIGRLTQEHHESGKSMQLSRIRKKHYQSYTLSTTALERKEERFSNADMMIGIERRQNGPDRMDMRHSKEDFSDFSHDHEISQNIATNSPSASLCDEVCTTRCITRVEELGRDPCAKGDTLFFILSDAAKSQNLNCSLPFQAHSLLQPLQALGLKNFSTRRYEPGWAILQNSRLETAFDGHFSESKQAQKDVISRIVPYALMAKGGVVKRRNHMKGLSLKYIESGTGPLSLGGDWLMGLALITGRETSFHFWDPSNATRIYSFTPADDLIKALHIDEGLRAFAADSQREKGAVSISLWNSRGLTNPVDLTRVPQGVVQGPQFRGYELYAHNAQNCTAVRHLRMEIKLRTDRSDEINCLNINNVGMDAVETEKVCAVAKEEVETKETTRSQQDCLWDTDAVRSAASEGVERAKVTTQLQQDTCWDLGGIDFVAYMEVGNAKETTQLQQATWWDMNGVEFAANEEVGKPKETTQLQQVIWWWDMDGVDFAANEEVGKANETTQLKQVTWWDMDGVDFTANGEVEKAKETTQLQQVTWCGMEDEEFTANEEVGKAKETAHLQQVTWWDTDAVLLTNDDDLADDFAQEWITVGKEDANAETEEIVLSLSVSEVRSISPAVNM